MDEQSEYYQLIENASEEIRQAIFIEEMTLQSKLEDHHILRDFFTTLLKKFLNMNNHDYEDWGYDIFSEIHYLCEFKQVLEFITSIKKTKQLRNKDTHNEKRREKQFETAKNNFIEKLLQNNQSDKVLAIKEISFCPEPTREDMIKLHKKTLYTLLTGYVEDIRLNGHCNTPKARAKKIIKIIDKI